MAAASGCHYQEWCGPCRPTPRHTHCSRSPERRRRPARRGCIWPRRALATRCCHRRSAERHQESAIGWPREGESISEGTRSPHLDTRDALGWGHPRLQHVQLLLCSQRVLNAWFVPHLEELMPFFVKQISDKHKQTSSVVQKNVVRNFLELLQNRSYRASKNRMESSKIHRPLLEPTLDPTICLVHFISLKYVYPTPRCSD